MNIFRTEGNPRKKPPRPLTIGDKPVDPGLSRKEPTGGATIGDPRPRPGDRRQT